VDPVTIGFLVGGLLLIGSELFHLSLVPVFFGAAALGVAGLRAVGLLPDALMPSLLAWSVASVGLAVPLRPLARRFFPTSKAVFDPSHEDKDAYGAIVEVVEAVDEDSNAGRIRFQGTTWAARSTEGLIPQGARAKLLLRDELAWVVEPISALDGIDIPAALPPANVAERVPPLSSEAGDSSSIVDSKSSSAKK
jgi:membrane protein implicated in regulation of membrane protease activity